MKKPKYVMNYKEGYVFAVPLRDGGFAMGIAARLSKRPGIVLGYFFGPRIRTLPPLDECRMYRPEHALWVQRFGDLDLVLNKWPILGPLADWKREEWPVPIFGTRDSSRSNLGFRFQYNPDDISKSTEMKLLLIDEVKNYWQNGMAGAGYIAAVLSNNLPEYDLMPDKKIGWIW